jgi:hypothetical protein
MILTPHILVGAAIGAKTQNLGLIVILGILSHFILDKIPHWDYQCLGIKNFKKTKNFKALFFNFLKIAIDGLIGLLIVLLVIWQKNILNLNYLPFILFGIFTCLLPDIALGFSLFFSGKFAKKYIDFHHRFLHYFKNKEKEGKITFLGLSTEILVSVIAIIILLL